MLRGVAGGRQVVSLCAPPIIPAAVRPCELTEAQRSGFPVSISNIVVAR
jgi:hypothetical protein